MSHTVKLSDELVEKARVTAAAQNRSVPGQIEYWAKIGRIAQENPDLPYDFIVGILESLEEVKRGNVRPFRFE